MPAFGLMLHHFHGRAACGGAAGRDAGGYATGGDAGGYAHPRVQGSISAGQFEEILRHVGVGRILSAGEWFERAARDALGDDDVCLTFDDNLRCQFDVALPVLRDYGLTAFWFVATGVFEGRPLRVELYRAVRDRCYEDVDAFYAAFFRMVATSPEAEAVERALLDFRPEAYLAEFPFYSEADRRFRFVRDRVLGPRRYALIMDALIADCGTSVEALSRGLWMDEACLRTLTDEGHVVGLHSHTHPTLLAALPAAEQLREYRDNFMTLLRITGRPPQSVSHPCNSYNADTLAVLRRLGVRVGFRANMARAGPVSAGAGALEMPREDHANILREIQTCESPYSPATSPVTSR